MRSVPSSGGTLTSETLGLGEADANARWIGVRRHQAVLTILGVGLAGDWVMSPHASLVELVAGLALAIGAVPCYDGLTLGEACLIALRFLFRSHWHELSVREFGDDVVLWAVGEVSFRGYELKHRGRLDLSGRDVTIAQGLATLADASSAGRGGQHFSQHVVTQRGNVRSLLTLPLGVPAPDGWTANNEFALGAVCVGSETTSLRVLERFTYLRTKDQLARVFRVRDFSSVPPTRGLLEQLLRSATTIDLALHVDVVSSTRAQRLAARAVHRVGSDDATSRTAGFRRTARSSRNFERLAQREVLVASGRSLLRIAVFIIVRGESYDEVQQRSSLVWRHAHDAGLRLERGWGLQSSWYFAQLPGGPGW
ncbi:MAG TPA: hypothetical protein VGZ68_08870 [Acidimicrobiales bacterium]|nr:hypothetical protein [Acidimicrobiales bacterium]